MLVLLKKPPQATDKRLLVIGTTSVASHLEDLQLVQGFNVTLNVPQVCLSSILVHLTMPCGVITDPCLYVELSQLTGPDEIKTVLREVASLSQKEMDDIAGAISKPIGIKQLLMVVEMARQGEESISTDRFLECLHICGF